MSTLAPYNGHVETALITHVPGSIYEYVTFLVGLTLLLPHPDQTRETATLALVAGAAVGVFGDLAAVAEASAPLEATWEPDPSDRAVYARLGAAHRAFADAVVEPFRLLDRAAAGAPEVPA